MPQSVAPLVLVVMDGWGIAPPGPYNATSVARTPFIDGLFAQWPSTAIEASGRAVGLPDGQMGNSEVGHLNLGAGRIVKQDLVLIDDEIAEGAFAKNPVFLKAIEKIRTASGRAHLIGLCSPGGVHSSQEHLFALVDLLHGAGLEVFIHALTDGRDTPPQSGRGYLKEIEARIHGKARIAVVVGRYFSMDRDKRWERVARGYQAHVAGVGTPQRNADEAMAAAYASGENDEFITPRIIVDAAGAPIGSIRDNDGVFCFNFRSDRVRELTAALALDNFDGFLREVRRKLSSYVCMTEYSADFGLPIAYAQRSMHAILGEVLAAHGLAQLRTAETEKYAHITFFFNGGVEKPFPGEDRRMVPSPRDVPTYDFKPEMSAVPVADGVVEAIESGAYPFILVNFANGDMVGHTGVLAAAVKAAETVDTAVGRIIAALAVRGGRALVTADHGNLEEMLDANGQPHTAHTTNPVPLILVSEAHAHCRLRAGGALRDVAPTVLELLGIDKPHEMTGVSLIER